MFAFKKKHDHNLICDLVNKIALQTPEFTPDIHVLEQNFWNPVFIPDECMLLGRQHDLVKEGASGFYPFYEDCYTSGKFTFLEKYLGKLSTGIPFEAINDDNLPMWMNKAYRIKGELYALSSKQIILLDNYKKNTVECRRIRVNINIPYTHKTVTRSQTYNGVWSATYNSSKTHISSIEAWMYVGRIDYWQDQLEHLDNFRPVYVVNDPDRIYVRKYYDYKRQNLI